MAIKTRRPVPMKKAPGEIQKGGLFTGIAQPGPARKKRAHALAEELVARGCMYLQSQVWDEAAREFRKAIKMEDDYAEAYNNLGLAMLYANKPSEAVEALETALQLFPNWNIAEVNLGLALSRVNRLEEACDYYRRALKAKSAQPAVWLALGDCLATLNLTDEALEAFNTAVHHNPKYDIAFHRIGMIHARRNNIEEAQASLSRALEIDPQNVDAASVLGAIAARQGDLNAARDYFAQVADVDPMPIVAKRGMNRLQVFRNGLRHAFDEWKTGMPQPPSLAVCYYNLGLAQLTAGNDHEAKNAFQQAADLQPDWSEPIIWFGFFAALDGDATAAKKYWENAVKLEPENGMLREQLAYLAVAMGLQKEADTHFASAADLGREIPEGDLKPDANVQ